MMEDKWKKESEAERKENSAYMWIIIFVLALSGLFFFMAMTGKMALIAK